QLLAGTHDLDFHATVLSATFAGGVRSDRAGFALAFRVDAVSGDALADQVVLDGVGATLGQTLVVLLATDGVGVTHGDQGFEVQGFNLRSNLIQNLATFGLQCVFVEVEEGVGVQDDLGGGGSYDRSSRSNRNTVAAGDTGGGRPECVAPAEFVGAVHPHVTERVAPIVHGLCGDIGRASCREWVWVRTDATV